MTLEELLLREQSRTNTDLLTAIVLKKPVIFDELWTIVLRNEDPVSRRAAWVADYCSEIQPEFIHHRIEELGLKVSSFKSDGLKRHSLRMLARSPLPDQNLGLLVDSCFKWLQSKSESVAVKMYCMVILERVCRQMPEISGELYDIIEMQMSEASPGFRSRGRKVMKLLKRY